MTPCRLLRLAIGIVLIVGIVAACRDDLGGTTSGSEPRHEACPRTIVYVVAQDAGAPDWRSEVVHLDSNSSEPARVVLPRFIAFGSGRAWSPVGRGVAVLSAGREDVPLLEKYGVESVDSPYAPPEGLLYVLDPDGSGLRRVAEIPVVEYDWSPQGDSIAFLSVHDGAGTGLYVVGDSGGAPRRIAAARWYGHGGPRWSPESRRVAYAAGEGDSELDIRVVDLETGEDRAVTDDPANDVEPAWSPTGERVAFLRERVDRLRERVRTEVWVVGAAGQDPRMLLDDGFWHIAGWSPDGVKLFAWLGDPEIVEIEVETGEVRAIRPNPRFSGLLLAARLDADGRRLVVLEGEEDGTHRVLELDPVGETVIELAGSIPTDMRYVDWSDCAKRP